MSPVGLDTCAHLKASGHEVVQLTAQRDPCGVSMHSALSQSPFCLQLQPGPPGQLAAVGPSGVELDVSTRTGGASAPASTCGCPLSDWAATVSSAPGVCGSAHPTIATPTTAIQRRKVDTGTHSPTAGRDPLARADGATAGRVRAGGVARTACRSGSVHAAGHPVNARRSHTGRLRRTFS